MPAPAPPRRRLKGLKDPTSKQTSKPAPATPPPTAVTKPKCCDEPKIEQDDIHGGLVCRTCFAEISRSDIVSDVTFQEDSRGAATVQGGYIGEHARHAGTGGQAMQRIGGGGERNTAQEVERNARRALEKFCPALGIPETTRNQAINIYSLASRSNFSAGRRTDEVAAASLYAACRRQRDNQVMLIDISELLQMNVFRLGEVYKDMCKDIHLIEGGGVGTQYLVEVESLVMKYCRKLEFADATRQVAEDAIKIVRRMKRDWMVTGRHPAGLCGACIILAARMNNFRRSTREVVYVAKVADITIAKRVAEFRRLKAASLTVEQFREYGVRLKDQADPPVLYETELKKMKFESLKRKRAESSMARNTAELAGLGSQQPSREGSTASAAMVIEDDDEARRKRQRTATGEPVTPPPTQQEPRRDADGFLIPALPAARTQTPAGEDQDREQTEEPRRRPGRPKRAPPQPIIITEEELTEENQLEHDINDNLNDEDIINSRDDIEKAKAEKKAKAALDKAEQLAVLQKQIAAGETKARRAAAGITWVNEYTSDEELTPEDLEAEFANDPEVQNCLLNENEQRVKEQIWVHHNVDWLRIQQEKAIVESVAKENGKEPQGKRKGGKGGAKKKRSKMGDGTTLAEATTPIETPADSIHVMMDKRNANYSKLIDWHVLNNIFEAKSSRATSTCGSATPTSKGGQSNVATPSSANAAGAIRRTESLSPSPSALSDVVTTQYPKPVNAAAADAAAENASTTSTPAPESPIQAQAAAEEDAEMEDDPDDYYHSEEENPYADQSDRESIGEDPDYARAVDNYSEVALEGYMGYDDFV